MTITEFVEMLMGLLGSLGFGLIFNIKGKKLLVVGFGGFLAWFFFVILKFLTPSESLRYFIVAVLASILAEIMARVMKTPTTTFHMGFLVPLIPGGSLYYTMAHIFEGDYVNFAERGLHTFSLAASLALGIVTITAATKIIYRILAEIKSKRKEKQKL